MLENKINESYRKIGSYLEGFMKMFIGEMYFPKKSTKIHISQTSYKPALKTISFSTTKSS